MKDNYMKKFELGVLLLALTLTSCSGGKESAESAKSSGNTSAASPGTAANATTSRLCALYTLAEIKELLGAPVRAGEVAGPMDSACQWNVSGGEGGYAQIQMINGTNYWE